MQIISGWFFINHSKYCSLILAATVPDVKREAASYAGIIYIYIKNTSYVNKCITNNSIQFMKDTKTLYTHGQPKLLNI